MNNGFRLNSLLKVNMEQPEKKLEASEKISEFIEERIKSMATDEDGWAKEDREIAQAELRRLNNKLRGII